MLARVGVVHVRTSTITNSQCRQRSSMLATFTPAETRSTGGPGAGGTNSHGVARWANPLVARRVTAPTGRDVAGMEGRALTK
jgi:hypothetical protein